MQYGKSRQWPLLALAGAVVGAFVVSRRARRDGQPSAASYHPAERGEGAGDRVVRRFTLQKQPGDVYRAFRDVQQWPRYFTYLSAVSEDGSNRWRWTAKLPNGRTVDWSVELTDDRDGQYLSWRAMPGSPIESRLSIRMEGGPPRRGTEVTVTLENRAVAAVPFGSMLARVVRLGLNEALRRFKQWVETGEIATTAGQPSGREPARRRDELWHAAEQVRRRRQKDSVDQASMQSFPASDAPASRGGM